MVFDAESLIAGLLGGTVLASCAWLVVMRKLERRNAELSLRAERVAELEQQMGGAFSVAAQEVLQKSNEQFLQLAQEKLKQQQGEQAHDFERRQKAISELVDPIQRNLKDMGTRLEALGKTGTGLEAQLKTFVGDQRLLREETRNLVEALRNPAARGRWGEMQLQRAFEMIGMIEGTHYTQQTSVSHDGQRKRPDFVMNMPGNMHIVVDVKTPIEPYWEAMDEAGNDTERKRALEMFRKKVRDHLKQLSGKEYWRHFDSPEFVVMFLPTEGLYSMAVSNDPALIEEAARQNVILASPTTLMGLLRVVMHGWQQQSMAEEAKKVAALGSDLYSRVITFVDHIQKVGTNLGRALNAYNAAVGSLESSVLPGVRKFKELHIQTGGKEISGLSEIDTAPRAITSQELLGREDESDAAGNSSREKKKSA